jgi:hypothetical protein
LYHFIEEQVNAATPEQKVDWNNTRVVDREGAARWCIRADLKLEGSQEPPKL